MPNWCTNVIMSKEPGLWNLVGGPERYAEMLQLVKPIPRSLLPFDMYMDFNPVTEIRTCLTAKMSNNLIKQIINKKIEIQEKKGKLPNIEWHGDWDKVIEFVKEQLTEDVFYSVYSQWYGTKWDPSSFLIKRHSITFSTPWGEPTIQNEIARIIPNYVWYAEYEGSDTVTIYECINGIVTSIDPFTIKGRRYVRQARRLIWK